MANLKISQLPVVTQSNNSDLLPIVSSGITSQITKANFASSLTAATASYVNSLTQSVNINGALNVTGTALINGNNIITYPYTGSASISGSLTVVGNILGYNSSSYIGNLAGFGANATSYSIFLGEQAGYSASLSANSVFLGAFSGLNNTSSSFTTVVGYGAGIYVTASGNSTMIGAYAGYSASYAVGSTFLGIYAGAAASASSYSTFVGPYAGYQLSGSSYSIALGYNTGFRSTLGNNNIIIGTEVTLASGSSNSINIGGLIFGSGSYFSTSSVSSGSANGYLGINQPNPQYSLDVSGSIRLSQALLLPPQNPLTIAATGSLATSGSNLYFYNGTGSNGGWAKII